MKIKFRVWDGKKMWYPEDEENWLVSIDGGLCKTYVTEDNEGTLFDTTSEFPGEYLLWTGRADSESQKIWVGDIIKAVGTRSAYPGGTEKWTKVFRVVWEDGCVKARYSNGSMTLIQLLREWGEEVGINLAVIGNIYENPDLVTK